MAEKKIPEPAIINNEFNPNSHLIQLKSKEGAKDYLPVQFRLVWFREKCPDGTIETEMLHLDLDRDTEEDTFVWNAEKRRSEKVTKQAKGFVIFRAVVRDGKGGIATGTKSEKAASFPDFIEKAETGAIGRALAALGYGTQFAPELSEAHRLVDAPVLRKSREDAPTKSQLDSIWNLCNLMNLEDVKEPKTYLEAKKIIDNLSAEYKEFKAEMAASK